jgi:hypothetical protein
VKICFHAALAFFWVCACLCRDRDKNITHIHIKDVERGVCLSGDTNRQTQTRNQLKTLTYP